MAERLQIGLLYGGRSGEHEVSLRSAAAVHRHLNKNLYDCSLIGISKEGRWYLQDPIEAEVPDILPLSCREERELIIVPGRGIFGRQAKSDDRMRLDLILPIIHGSFGEDGILQGALDTAGVPYAASGVLGSALGMDKAVVKKVWSYHGLPVVPYRIARKAQYDSDIEGFESLLDELFSEFSPPIFVKPNCTGSSLGVRKVYGREECYDAVREAFRYDRTVLLEKGITGKEIECAVLGGSPPKVSVTGEIIPKAEFYDYKAKYIDEDGARLVIPAELSTETADIIRQLASDSFLAAEAEGFARVDFFVEEESGRIYINEINTIPGFTSISMFPRLFIESGMSFGEILDTIIDCALKRQKERSDIVYSYEAGPLTSG